MSIKSSLPLASAVVALALLAGGCHMGPDAQTQAKLDSLSKAATDRERLLAEVADNDRMMSEVSAELARLRIPARVLHVQSESPLGAARDSVVAEVKYVSNLVSEAEHKLRESEHQIAGLKSLSDSLRATLQATVANYDSVIARQKEQIAELTDQVDQLTAKNTALTTANAALTDTTTVLKQQNNTVYYIVGTRDDLLRRGIIVEVGGSRFPLLFAKVGQTIVPSRALDPKDFTAINKRDVTEIPLTPAQSYRIASRQDIEGLATPTPDGRVSGQLRIANPDRFWSTSKFLILIQG